ARVRMWRELDETGPLVWVVVDDGVVVGYWTGVLYGTEIAGRLFIPNRGFASIGYGLPGGMGACFAASDRSVVAISGDGGFNMMLGELETARRAGLGLTVIVLNNAASGYVKALQHAMMGGRYQSADLVEMNYAAIARAMGCGGIRVEDPETLSGAVRRGMEERDRPTVIDVVVTRDRARMLRAVDNGTVEIKQGDRVAGGRGKRSRATSCRAGFRRTGNRRKSSRSIPWVEVNRHSVEHCPLEKSWRSGK